MPENKEKKGRTKEGMGGAPRRGDALVGIYRMKYLGLGFKALTRANPRFVRVIYESGKMPELKRIVDFVEGFLARYPGKAPTWKYLKNGSPSERRDYRFMQKNGLLGLLEKYKPYGDPKVYYELTHPGKSIGQVQRADPNFVNYCRYHRLENIMPKQQEMWVGREVDEFLLRHGRVTSFKNLLQTKEGRRSYMRVFRAGKLAELKKELGMRAPIKRNRKT